MEDLAIYTGVPTVHWEDIKKYVSLMLKLKGLLLELNTFIFLSVFYKSNLTMISLFQNMRSPVSCRQICAPNHVQFQLSVGLLNGLSIEYIAHSHVNLNNVGARHKIAPMEPK